MKHHLTRQSRGEKITRKASKTVARRYKGMDRAEVAIYLEGARGVWPVESGSIVLLQWTE